MLLCYIKTFFSETIGCILSSIGQSTYFGMQTVFQCKILCSMALNGNVIDLRQNFYKCPVRLDYILFHIPPKRPISPIPSGSQWTIFSF